MNSSFISFYYFIIILLYELLYCLKAQKKERKKRGKRGIGEKIVNITRFNLLHSEFLFQSCYQQLSVFLCVLFEICFN